MMSISENFTDLRSSKFNIPLSLLASVGSPRKALFVGDQILLRRYVIEQAFTYVMRSTDAIDRSTEDEPAPQPWTVIVRGAPQA